VRAAALEGAMKKILMIGTGGTIASEMTKDGLTPELTPEQLVNYVPAVSGDVLRAVPAAFQHRQHQHDPRALDQGGAAVRDNYDAFDGFVISHGTDTMAYTAAALSYMIQGSPKPIILTGAQKPINFDNTDSKINLLDAFTCACADGMSGVNIVFNGKVILGTRARKTRSKSFQAFSSINYPDVATLQDGYLMQYIRQDSLPRPEFCDTLDTSVGLVKMIPGIDFELLEFMLSRKDAVIIESFGVGGLPSYNSDRFFDIIIEKGIQRGKYIIMTTQVQNEGSNLAVYNVGHRLKGWRYVLEAYDMTTESVLAKIMWILAAQRTGRGQVAELFYRPVANDILYRG
jgi:L-asparaginase